MSDLVGAKKSDVEHNDKADQLLPDELPRPEGIEHLNEVELDVLEKNLTRRLDLTLLPVIFILFLLNILYAAKPYC